MDIHIPDENLHYVDASSLPDLEVPILHGDVGELHTPTEVHETQDIPPFTAMKWKPERSIASMVADGVTITLRLTPYAIMVWIFAPDDVKYEAKKYIRYLPWAVKYAVWWLKQKD